MVLDFSHFSQSSINTKCSHFILYCLFISVVDADGDDVRCRWAEQSQRECGGVCQAINATLCGVKLYWGKHKQVPYH